MHVLPQLTASDLRAYGGMREKTHESAKAGLVRSSTDKEAGTPSQEQAHADKMALAQFAVRMEYKGVECTAELALTPDMIEHLALEAEFRNLRIGELIRDLILSTVKNDLFRLVYGA